LVAGNQVVGDPFSLGVLERSPLVPDVPRRSLQILAGIGDCRRAGKLIVGIEFSLCRFGVFAGSLGRIGFRWSNRARTVFRLGLRLGRRLRGSILLVGVVGFFRLPAPTSANFPSSARGCFDSSQSNDFCRSGARKRLDPVALSSHSDIWPGEFFTLLAAYSSTVTPNKSAIRRTETRSIRSAVAAMFCFQGWFVVGAWARDRRGSG